MDAFVIHPYADNSSQSPATAHPNSTTIGVADYGKLVALLGEAFDEGVAVEPLHLGPFGRDPLAVRVGRMTVAIRRAHARAVQVILDAA